MPRPSPLALLLACAPLVASAAPFAVQLTHSGYLLGSDETPVEAASQAFTFRLHDDPSGGSVKWTGACSTSVRAGYFTVTLGAPDCGPTLDTTALPPGAVRWLSIDVGTTSLTPRLAVVSSATAVLASEALHAATADALGGTAANLYQLKSDRIDYARLDNTPSVQTYAADGATLQLASNTFAVKSGGIGATQLALDASSIARVSGNALSISAGDLTSTGSITVTGTGKKFLGNGSGLTALDATNVTTGTLPIAVLPTIPDTQLASSGDLAKLAGAQTITGLKTFNPASGSVPFAVDATKSGVITNLNADQVDGVHIPTLPFTCPAGQSVTGLSNVGGVLTPSCTTPTVGGGTVSTSSTEPACTSAQVGNIYYHLTDNAFYGCNGTRWVPFYGVLDGSTPRRAAASCRQLRADAPWLGNGTYLIDPNGAPSTDAFTVYCNMSEAGGGWTRVANVQAEIGICSYTNGFGTANDVNTDTGTTGAFSAATITSWNIFTDKLVMVTIGSNAGSAVYSSANAAFTWANIANGTINTSNIANYAVSVSLSGGALQTLANGAGCNQNSGCLFAGYYPTGNWTPIIGIGSYSRGSFTQDATCVSQAATNAYKGTYSGVPFSPASTWNQKAAIYIR